MSILTQPSDPAVPQAAPACPPGAKPWRRRRFHLPIAAVLVLGFGGLMLLAVSSVLILGLNLSSRNTAELVADKASLMMAGLEARVRSQLEPARFQAEYVAAMLARGEVGPEEEVRLADTMKAALAGSRQITGVGFLSAQGTFILATRTGPDTATSRVERDVHWAGDTLKEALQTGGAVWFDPLWAEEERTSVLTVRVPVRRDGKFLGVVMTGVSFHDLSRFLAAFTDVGSTESFILFDERYVLAHPALAKRRLDFDGVKDRPPLPTLEEINDPIAANIWQQVDPQGRPTAWQKANEDGGFVVKGEFKFPGDEALDLRSANVGGTNYVYLTKTMADYGTKPWTLAIAFDEAQVKADFQRLALLGLVGLGILVGSVLLALLLGWAISRQVKRLAGAAVALRDFQFETVPQLPDSRFREISDAARAFNTMVAGLRWFETYVPKPLVLRLIRREGGAEGVRSEERDVTVLFTDVKGFSAMAESMTPQQTAAWLNRHFTRIAACIEAEGGTVDKFIGDAVMAFWGAPEDQPDHAARALRAALAIVQVVKEEADEARAQGVPPVCLRVGIHSGPVVVGNIGASSRINYTIVGDTVNTAARLEALGSDLLGQDCIVVLASGDAVAAAGACAVDIPLQDMGAFTLRGRSGPVTVWRLGA